MWPLSSVVVIYFQQITGSYTTAMSVYAICSLVQTVLEIPSGIISDKYPRSKILLTTTLSILACFILWFAAGIFNSYSCLILGSVLYGINIALTSGTLDAFIYETVKDMNKEVDFGTEFSKLNTYSQVGLCFGAVSAMVILHFSSLNMLAFFSILPAVLQSFFALKFVEPQRLYINKKLTSLKCILIALRRIWRHKKLFLFVVIRVFESSVETALHRFEAAYFKTIIPDSMIASIRIFKQLFGIIGFYLYSFISKFNKFKIYISALTGNIIVRTIAVCLNGIISPFLMAFVNIFYGAATTSGTALMQKEFSSQQRATLQSIISLIVGLIIALIMFLFGIIADTYSPKAAILLAIGIKMTAVILFSIKGIKLW